MVEGVGRAGDLMTRIYQVSRGRSHGLGNEKVLPTGSRAVDGAFLLPVNYVDDDFLSMFEYSAGRFNTIFHVHYEAFFSKKKNEEWGHLLNINTSPLKLNNTQDLDISALPFSS